MAQTGSLLRPLLFLTHINPPLSQIDWRRSRCRWLRARLKEAPTVRELTLSKRSDLSRTTSDKTIRLATLCLEDNIIALYKLETRERLWLIVISLPSQTTTEWHASWSDFRFWPIGWMAGARGGKFEMTIKWCVLNKCPDSWSWAVTMTFVRETAKTL